MRQATGKVQQTLSDLSAGKCSRPQGCLNPFCDKETCQEKGKSACKPGTQEGAKKTSEKRKISTKQIENEWHTRLWQAGRKQEKLAKHEADADAWQQSEDGAVYLVAEDAKVGRPAAKMDLR